MGLLLQIVGAFIIAALLAYAVVKLVPLKMRWLVSILLLLVAGFLGYKIYDGIMAPIRFDIEKQKRFSKVIDNLKLIRDAEVKYSEVYGKYTTSQDTLVMFIENGKLPITETKNVVRDVRVGSGLTVKKSFREVDTIGWEPVMNLFKGKDYKNMFKVPGTNKEFSIETGRVEKVQGLEVPVFLAKTDKASVLKGMDPSLVKQELEAITSDEIKGADIMVGSLEEVSTGGNWPPSYDKADAVAKKE